MEDIVVLVKAWERLKAITTYASISNPAVIDEAVELMKGTTAVEQMLPRLDDIVSSAQHSAATWIACPGPIPLQLVKSDGLTAVHAILKIWEAYAAISVRTEKLSDRERWIECLPSEARRLVLRLRRQIELPTR